MEPTDPAQFAKILAPMLLGVMLACPLYGVAVAQAVIYFRQYPDDRAPLKYCVAILLLLDGAHTVAATGAIKAWFFRNEVDYLTTIALPISSYLSYTASATVQGVYAWRVWILSGSNRAIAAAFTVLITTHFGNGMVMATIAMVSKQIGATGDFFRAGIRMILGSFQTGSALLCDCLISGSLVYHLRRSRSGLKSTENLVDRLILYGVGLGTLTSAFSLLTMLLWLFMRDNYVFVTFHFLISKLYVNSLLVSLNSRRHLRRRVSQNLDLSTWSGHDYFVTGTHPSP